MADYLDFLVDDESTRVIALALEKIRRPEAFFAAAAAGAAGRQADHRPQARAHQHGAAVMTQSHTGTVIGDAWVYDVAFRQARIDDGRRGRRAGRPPAVPGAAARRQVDRPCAGSVCSPGRAGSPR